MRWQTVFRIRWKLAEAERCGTTLDEAMHILTAWSILDALHYNLKLGRREYKLTHYTNYVKLHAT